MSCAIDFFTHEPGLYHLDQMAEAYPDDPNVAWMAKTCAWAEWMGKEAAVANRLVGRAQDILSDLQSLLNERLSDDAEGLAKVSELISEIDDELTAAWMDLD